MANECQALLLASLTNYYNKYPNNKKKLIEIITAKEAVSVKTANPEAVKTANPEAVKTANTEAVSVKTANTEAVKTANPEAVKTANTEAVSVKTANPEAVKTANPEAVSVKTANTEAVKTANTEAVSVKTANPEAVSVKTANPEAVSVKTANPEAVLPKVSLRVLDWFVTHYAKSKQIIYWIDDSEDKVYFEYPEHNSNLRKFNLYYEYRAQLQSYTKMYFDPFRRHNRISFNIEENSSVETTVGQLNFFKWIIHNHVLEYINLNIKDIENHMSLYQKSVKNIVNIVPKKVENKVFQISSNTPCIIRFD